MTTWDIAATNANVMLLFGSEQRSLAGDSVQSAVERAEYARYHYHEANELFAKFAQQHLTELPLIAVVFSQNDGVRSDFQMLMTMVGANVVACLQSMHSLADILAHAVYYSLGENLRTEPLVKGAISAAAVADRIGNRPTLAEVHRLLSAVKGEGQFSHLSALVNYSKHRGILRTSVFEDMTGRAAQRHTLKLPKFEFKGKCYPDVDARLFVQQEFDRLSALLIELGNALNKALLAKMR